MGDSSERREGKARSRWLWALLAGVVLVAIAAAFWIDQTNVLPPVSRGTTPVAPAPSPAPIAQKAVPSAPSLPSPPAAPEAAAPPAPLRRPMQDSKPPRCPLRPRRPPKSPRLPRSSRRSLRPRLLQLRSPNHPCRRPRPDGNAAGSPGRICAQEPCAAGRDLGLFRGGLRAPLPAARRRLGLSAAGGQVRPGRDRRIAEENPSAFRHLPD